MPPSTLSLQGRTCVVTGAAQGVGAAEAILLADCGATVLCVDQQDPTDTVEAIRRAGGIAYPWHGDITASAAPDAIVAAATDLGRPITTLVNNAGIVRDRMAFNMTDDDWDTVLAVNLTAPFRLCRAVIQHWRMNPTSLPRRIINTSSESGLYGNAGQSNYAAAKAGVAALTLTLASELARQDIGVNAIAPRARTPMSQAAFGESTDETLDPRHVATAIAWLASDQAEGITGQVFVVAGPEVHRLHGWAPHRHARQPNAWTTEAIGQFRHDLFAGEPSRHVPGPIGDLFRAPPQTPSQAQASGGLA
jgi:NAD(P)-dependent dehydrogenase (short-subunit alcohol dehydrogenase family)